MLSKLVAMMISFITAYHVVSQVLLKSTTSTSTVSECTRQSDHSRSVLAPNGGLQRPSASSCLVAGIYTLRYKDSRHFTTSAATRRPRDSNKSVWSWVLVSTSSKTTCVSLSLVPEENGRGSDNGRAERAHNPISMNILV